MKAKLLIIFVCLLFLGAIGAVGAFRAKQASEAMKSPSLQPAVVECVAVEKRSFKLTETFYGLIEANMRVDMAFQITGRLAALGPEGQPILRESDDVAAGSVIAQLESDRFLAAVEQARARGNQAKASMSEADALIVSATAEHADAVTNAKRVRSLYETGGAKQREVETAELAVIVTNAAIERAKAGKATAEAAYSESVAATTLAQVNVRDATLRAPFAGRVAKVQTEIGQIVAPGEPVMTLVDMNTVRLVIGVVERKLPMLRVGQKVNVEVSALRSMALQNGKDAPVTAFRTGTIITVPPAADQKTGVFDVEIAIDNTDGLLKSGMIGKAEVALGQRAGWGIPAEAAARVGDNIAAFFVTEGYQVGLNLGNLGQASINVPTSVARRVALTPLGVQDNFYLVETLPGDYDRLIVRGQNRLSDGQPVEIVGDSAAPAKPQTGG